MSFNLCFAVLFICYNAIHGCYKICNSILRYYMYKKKQDKNSMMSWSINFIIAIITQPYIYIYI